MEHEVHVGAIDMQTESTKFREYAQKYRMVVSHIRQVESSIGRLNASHDPVLEIVFTHVADYVEGGARSLEDIAQRLAQRSGAADPSAAPINSNDAFESTCANEGDLPSLDYLARELYQATTLLEETMNQALDSVDRIADEEITGDTHPFGHIVQGICLPYLMLGVATLAPVS